MREIAFETQIRDARVVSRCGCGCPSIEFSISGTAPSGGSGLRDVTDEFYWTSKDGHIYAVVAYEKANQLAGLEIYSVDGLSTPTSLPQLPELKTGPQRYAE